MNDQTTAEPKTPDLRRVVLDLLLSRSDYPTRQFGEYAQRAGLPDRDRSLARQLLAGALRWAPRLDAIYQPYCSRRVQDDALTWTLRLGVLQLFFLSNVPPHAAVHSTLQAARPLLRERLGFANAVLRALTKAAQAEQPMQEAFSRKRLVVGRRSWFFDRPLFHDPAIRPVGHWAIELAFPPPLVRRWFDQVGEETALARMHSLNQIPPIWLRVQLARTSKDELLKLFQAEGLEVHDCDHPRLLRLVRPGRSLDQLPGFQQGQWAVQDRTSLESVELAQPLAGERILDLCAAPGGKSFALAELTAGQAEIVACDVSAQRLAQIQPEAERLGHELRTHLLAEDGSGLPEGPFDLVVLDVPCTNTGVLHKRLEARSRFRADEVHRATTQQNLIRKRLIKELLKQGCRPRVLWTTCSLEPEENQDMTARFARQANYRIEEQRTFEPDGLRSGGFAAILVPES